MKTVSIEHEIADGGSDLFTVGVKIKSGFIPVWDFETQEQALTFKESLEDLFEELAKSSMESDDFDYACG